MNDTRETLSFHRPEEQFERADNEGGRDIQIRFRGECRFRKGDMVVDGNTRQEAVVLDDPFWDFEFGGWLVVRGMIGVHESNFVLASEVDQWEAHQNGLWSWWEKKARLSE